MIRQILLRLVGSDTSFLTMAMVIASVVVGCFFTQRFFKRDLERDQYYYLRDIGLIASWAICGIWTQSGPMKLMITAGVIAGLVGFCQKVVKNWDLRFCYLAIGLGVALLGPRITFIGRPDGEFMYLSSFTTILILSTLWMGFFPILFQELDEIPGMGGGLILVSWVLMVIVTAMSSKGPSDALMMSICGLALIIVFWTRHVNVYRRLGTQLSAMWGTLLAGTSMLGASKGVAFATVMILPLGLFAIPIIETSLSVLSAAFSPKPLGNMIFYRKLVRGGVDHPVAIFIVIAVCGVCGVGMALLQMRLLDPMSLVITLACLALGLYIAFVSGEGHNDISGKRPTLWGVSVDNFSLDYALGRVVGWVSSGNLPQTIVTPDALATLLSRRDKKYASIVQKAGLVIPDGTGLVWALRFLGFQVQERIPGVDFVDNLCRIAPGHGWSFFFFGGQPGVALRAADKVCKKYPGLEIKGTRSGFFQQEENDDICREIRESGATILLVALGMPKQEYWLCDNLSKLGGIVGIGVGGSFDVMSGRLNRAPAGWRKIHLEWLYRTIQEPYRWRRVMRLPVFVALVLLQKIGLDFWRNPV
ncbi:MAG: WecB/TagA/CpsF family glycosyltransferase [Synergistaceae bacterium]|jgi:N-acetylglucosaminyldiphosphoundecaprenol N-acetyl-beta-D-mannosaminyltransferase|nr:WecB/TagA/CpsF family glycosyltransferase [Synergistaceae bacterium]